MCDSPAKSGYRGWRGWLALPAARSETPRGDWVDLTYPFSPDVPRHVFLDGPAMEAIPLERCMGRGVVVRIDTHAYGVIEPADLERVEPRIEPGDIVAIDTGWGKTWSTREWDQQPCLSVEAARWLLDKRVKMLAVDTPTPDVPLDRRPADFTWPVHRTLLAHGILIAEQLANLDQLAGQRVEFIFGALPIAGSDGSPARVLARAIAA